MTSEHESRPNGLGLYHELTLNLFNELPENPNNPDQRELALGNSGEKISMTHTKSEKFDRFLVRLGGANFIMTKEGVISFSMPDIIIGDGRDFKIRNDKQPTTFDVPDDERIRRNTSRAFIEWAERCVESKRVREFPYKVSLKKPNNRG